MFSQRIVAWHAQTSKGVELVRIPLRLALWERKRSDHPVVREELVHHSDAGSQGGFNWSSQHLDHGGVREWRRQTGVGRPVMFRKVCGGSGVRIGRCVRRCDPPGRPEPSRVVQRQLWCTIATGVTTAEASLAVSVSVPVGTRWFRHAGGMSPISLTLSDRAHRPISVVRGT